MKYSLSLLIITCLLVGQYSYAMDGEAFLNVLGSVQHQQSVNESEQENDTDEKLIIKLEATVHQVDPDHISINNMIRQNTKNGVTFKRYIEKDNDGRVIRDYITFDPSVKSASFLVQAIGGLGGFIGGGIAGVVVATLAKISDGKKYIETVGTFTLAGVLGGCYIASRCTTPYHTGIDIVKLKQLDLQQKEFEELNQKHQATLKQPKQDNIKISTSSSSSE